MIIVTAVKCLCIIFYSGNIPNYDNCNCSIHLSSVCKRAYVIFYSGNIPNYDNCSCCKMPMYYIL